MGQTWLASVLGLLLGWSTLLSGQDPHLSPDAPRDQPVSASNAEQLRRIDAAIAPYVAQARASYPPARARYLAGLPPQESFFVSAKLHDEMGRQEMVFVAVDSIARDSIYGRIWNQVNVIRRYRAGDQYAVREAELLDWLISKPDGSEEGNVVGKFLDTYQP
jgi:Uncharacterized protein conserved in bacteria (DUF2314)